VISKRLSIGLAFTLCLAMLAGSGVSAVQRAAIVRRDRVSLAAADEVLKAVSRLRRLEIKSAVKSSAKTKDEIEQFVIRDLDESTPPEDFESNTKLMEKLGLVPRGFRLRDYVVKLLREQVAGFYDPKTREFYLAAWLPIREQKRVMAHELVHALQDQHFDLRRFEKWPKGDSDAELAAHALIEGDATMLMIQYDIDQQGLKVEVIKLPSLTDAMLTDSAGDTSKEYPMLSAAPRVLRETLQFPYVYGAGFAQAVWRERSIEDLNRSYSELPASTEQIIHPAKFLTRDNPVKIVQPDLAAELGKDWKLLERDVNGEFGYRLILEEFIPKTQAQTAAEGWGGDQYSLYENRKTGALVLIQYASWDTAADAKEFFDAYSERTRKRYSLPTSALDTLGRDKADPTYAETNDGLVSIDLKDKDVLIIEGASSRQELSRLTALLWKNTRLSR
jgi:hypothetical protein